MLDARITPLLNPFLVRIVQPVDKAGISPNQVSVVGFAFGLIAIPLLSMQMWYGALLFIVLNRIFDGLDGALARTQKSATSSGGYLDICLDFLFYSFVPLGFALADPAQFALPALVLVVSFVGTGSSFLAFAIVAQKFNIEKVQFKHKSFYYMQGLTEGFETIMLFVLCCLFPQYFSIFAYVFASLCAFTTVTRIYGGFSTIKEQENQ
ncbi:CDP-alcohol phosphatidyltransferase family protein [Vibrio sp. WJH972]